MPTLQCKWTSMVIQKLRTWINPQPCWFMAPLRLCRRFQATQNQQPEAAYLQRSLRQISFQLPLPSWISYQAIDSAFVFQFARPTSIIYLIWCLVCVLSSVPLLKALKWWLLHSSHISCDGYHSILRPLFQLTLALRPTLKVQRTFICAGNSLLTFVGFQLLYPWQKVILTHWRQGNLWGTVHISKFDLCWLFVTIML